MILEIGFICSLVALLSSVHQYPGHSGEDIVVSSVSGDRVDVIRR